MRVDLLRFVSRGCIFSGLILAGVELLQTAAAGPGKTPTDCVYSKNCTTNGYSNPDYTCKVPDPAKPATSGTGTGSKIYFANGLCGDEYDADDKMTGYGCGDSAADTNPDCWMFLIDRATPSPRGPHSLYIGIID